MYAIRSYYEIHPDHAEHRSHRQQYPERDQQIESRPLTGMTDEDQNIIYFIDNSRSQYQQQQTEQKRP